MASLLTGNNVINAYDNNNFPPKQIRFPDRVVGLIIVNNLRVWRNLRKKLSPTFTSGRLKRMLEPMENVADKFVRHLETCAREGVEVDMKAAMKGLLSGNLGFILCKIY